MLTKTRKSLNHHFKSKTKSKKCKPESQIVCKTNVLESFETDFEKKFKTATKTENSSVERYLVNLFKTPFAPSKYTPHNDYYTYINYQWIAAKKKEMEQRNKYYVQVDSFRMVQEKVFYELIEMTKE